MRMVRWMCDVIPHLHDTAGCQTGCTTVLNKQSLFVQPVVKPSLTTVLNEQLFVQPVVKPGCTTGCIHDTSGCQTGCETGMITGWMFVYTIQPQLVWIVYTNIYPVVKPVWQPAWQQVISCKRGLTVPPPDDWKRPVSCKILSWRQCLASSRYKIVSYLVIDAVTGVSCWGGKVSRGVSGVWQRLL